ncbi:MAG: hypothetical protein LBU64_07750 [Planctomycetota bacterium]|jgi:hypothetical protein|nr:hypothetical protein [Planctomycetota bacterium]
MGKGSSIVLTLADGRKLPINLVKNGNPATVDDLLNAMSNSTNGQSLNNANVDAFYAQIAALYFSISTTLNAYSVPNGYDKNAISLLMSFLNSIIPPARPGEEGFADVDIDTLPAIVNALGAFRKLLG